MLLYIHYTGLDAQKLYVDGRAGGNLWETCSANKVANLKSSASFPSLWSFGIILWWNLMPVSAKSSDLQHFQILTQYSVASILKEAGGRDRGGWLWFLLLAAISFNAHQCLETVSALMNTLLHDNNSARFRQKGQYHWYQVKSTWVGININILILISSPSRRPELTL